MIHVRFATFSMTFFIDIGPSLASKIKSSKKHYSNFLKNSLSESMFINATNEREIEKIINSLNKNKALGPNSIPIKILKQRPGRYFI